MVNDLALHISAGSSPESMLVLTSSKVRVCILRGGSDPLNRFLANIMDSTCFQSEIQLGIGPDRRFESSTSESIDSSPLRPSGNGPDSELKDKFRILSFLQLPNSLESFH